jgi:hypothetical protein
MEIDPARIIATGTWLYDGTLPCKVIIQREDVWPAFDDPEDDPEAEDKVMPCVSVWYESPGGGNPFSAGRGYYHTVERKGDAPLLSCPLLPCPRLFIPAGDYSSMPRAARVVAPK